MSTVAMSNASGAQNSHQFSKKLVEVMGEFTALVAQFKIGEAVSSGMGAHGAAVEEHAGHAEANSAPETAA
jgi:hypothetical protein